LIVSLHADTWQMLPVQTPLLQSAVPVLHVEPSAQSGHVPPPQSFAVSAPFSFPSVHVGA
jgi:hypothetical protein